MSEKAYVLTKGVNAITIQTYTDIYKTMKKTVRADNSPASR